jgi:ATP-dependent RNA circularization protein (DNA/RNA ligase family)
MEIVPAGYPKYPKIETCFIRDDKFNVTDEVRLKEIENIRTWFATEKIDGTNTRIIYDPASAKVWYGGRTDRTDPRMFEKLGLVDLFDRKFSFDKFGRNFPDVEHGVVVLYGESYGKKINSSGNLLGDSVSFRLFDVQVGNWWLEWGSVEDIAPKFNVKTVPKVGSYTFDTLIKKVKEGIPSKINKEVTMEGVVCRTVPMLLRRNGNRLIIKLKTRDFAESN